MKLFRKISILFLLITSSAIAATEKDEPIIRTSVDKKTIFIGDRIKYALKSDEAIELELPKFEDGKIGDFEIKERGRNWYEITAYSAGVHLIPPIDVRYRKKRAKDWSIQKTAETTIIVESVLPKSEKPKDIKDIKGPVYFYEINWVLVLGALTIFIFCTAAHIAYRRRLKRMPLRLPHETALEELEVIKGLFSRAGDIKEYYVGVSGCIRRYIERVFKLKAPEMTTEEFLISLRDSAALSPEQKRLVKEFLTSCDLVKFAKYAPTKKEMESVYLTAKNFIEETKEISLKNQETK